MFLVELVYCLTVRPSDYLKSNKRICMISYQRFVSSQGTKEQQLDFGDGPDYDPDPNLPDLHETFIRCVSLAKDQSNKLWE